MKKNFYLSFAERLRACGSVSREDVLQEVTRYYVYESAKGFDKFAVVRTFWAVYALANASDAHSDLLDQCKRMVAP